MFGKKSKLSEKILILGLGGVGLYLAKRLVHEGYEITVIESEGGLLRLADGDLGGGRGWQKLAAVQRYPKPVRFPGPKFSIGWVRAHIHSLYSFLDAVARDSEPSPSLEDGIRLQRVLEAARESAGSGQWVDL